MRLIVHEPIPLSKLTALCIAAEGHGNGTIEITQRGSLQIRGLSEASAPRFADEVASLRIAADDGPPLVTSPLLGLDACEPFDATALIPALFDVFKNARGSLTSLNPKVSVLVDGGGILHLDAINADIRLVAASNRVFQLALAGTASDATHLGYVTSAQAAEAVAKLLAALARGGPTTRARDLALDSLELNIASGCSPNDGDRAEPGRRPPANPLGIYTLKDGSRALGVALPFGHTTARALQRVIQAAADHGATSMRPSPSRALLIVGVSQSAAEKLRALIAREEDWVVDAHDPRRHVVACAGAPACASAKLSTREFAPKVARVTRAWAGTSKVVHLAGCSKGCAHPGLAALTVVGPDRIVVNGRASDPPHDSGRYGNVSGLLDQIERLHREL